MATEPISVHVRLDGELSEYVKKTAKKEHRKITNLIFALLCEAKEHDEDKTVSMVKEA